MAAKKTQAKTKFTPAQTKLLKALAAGINAKSEAWNNASGKAWDAADAQIDKAEMALEKSGIDFMTSREALVNLI